MERGSALGEREWMRCGWASSHQSRSTPLALLNTIIGFIGLQVKRFYILGVVLIATTVVGYLFGQHLPYKSSFFVSAEPSKTLWEIVLQSIIQTFISASITFHPSMKHSKNGSRHIVCPVYFLSLCFCKTWQDHWKVITRLVTTMSITLL